MIHYLVSVPTKMNTTMPPYRSLSRVTWGSTIEIVGGAPIGTDGIWLDGSTVATEATDIMSSLQFAKRRSLLAKHLLVLRKKGPIDVSI